MIIPYGRFPLKFHRIWKDKRNILLRTSHSLSWENKTFKAKRCVFLLCHIDVSCIVLRGYRIASITHFFGEQGRAKTILNINLNYVQYMSSRWQGWPCDESTHLPPVWPGFDFRTWCHMWIEFVGSLLYHERFFSRVLRFSPFIKNQHLI